MKKIVLLIPFFYLFSSCSEDVSRTITTDLKEEATQFYKFSEAIHESSYLGNISYPDFFRIESKDLPGCPTITRNSENRIIELDYSNVSECEQTNKTPRSGKIILDFSKSNTPDPRWSLTYLEYTFDGTAISGSRQYVNISINENQETYQNLVVELENNLGFQSSGEFSYSIARLNFRPFAVSIRGKIKGTNPAGRDFSLVITEAKEQQFACYRDGWELPQRGKESWIVNRSQSTSLGYTVKFETGSGCNPTVTSTLPDGRLLQLNP